MAAADCAMWLAIKRHIGVEHDAVTLGTEHGISERGAPRDRVLHRPHPGSSASASSTAPPNATTGRGKIFTHHSVTYRAHLTC